MIKKHKLFIYFSLILLVVQVVHAILTLSLLSISNLSYTTETTILTISFQVLLFLAVLFSFKWFKIKWYFHYEKLDYKIIGFSLLIFFGVFILQNIMDYNFVHGILNSHLKLSHINFEFSNFNISNALALFSMIIVAPILEEIIYRYIIFNKLLSSCNVTISVVLSSFLFAIMHLDLNGLVAYFFIGIFFTYLYYLTKSLWLNILLHMLWNLLIQFTKIEVISFSNSDFLIYISIYVLATIALIWGLKSLLVLKKKKP